MPRLSIARLFDDNREKLKLAWASGRAGGEKDLDSELIKGSSKGLIGHLNFIHPNWIQVLGPTETQYLERLDAHSRRETLTDVASRGLACFIAAEAERLPSDLCAGAARAHVTSGQKLLEALWAPVHVEALQQGQQGFGRKHQRVLPGAAVLTGQQRQLGTFARHLATVNRCWTLFATHYFELTSLATPESGIANVHLDAVEHGDSLVFMHAVREGAADRSFGLQVAALAGLPKAALAQARRRLAELEQRGRETHAAEVAPQALDAPQQFGLFAQAPSAAQEALAALDPDELTPKQALEALYRLKSLL